MNSCMHMETGLIALIWENISASELIVLLLFVSDGANVDKQIRGQYITNSPYARKLIYGGNPPSRENITIQLHVLAVQIQVSENHAQL